MKTLRLVSCVVTLTASFSIGATAGAADVTAARIVGADKEPQNWLSNGRTYSEQRFSPLKKINTGNVDELGLAWSHAIDHQRSCLEPARGAVPGNPKEGFESKTVEMIARTWNGEWWKQGGGGTVWDSIAYDPELDRLYIGVGNGSSWSWKLRSENKGDNLFLASIVAIRPDSGEYVWHLPDHAGRRLGLYRDPTHDPGRPDRRRDAAPGHHAGAEERLLLRARSPHR